MVRMKKIGLIGGLSWYSTAAYYRTINEQVQRRRGGHASASITLESLDFSLVRELQERGAWDDAGRHLADAGRRCQAAGADVLLICSNLMHRVADDVQAAADIPLLHITDAVAAAARARGITSLGVLGTRWVMEEGFYLDRLGRSGLTVHTPCPDDREMVDRVIFDELTQGQVRPESRRAYQRVIADLTGRGARAVVLGCTEIEELVGPDDSPVPLIDSMRAHAEQAVAAALEDPMPVPA
jgi:aspartate racemase